MILKIMKIINKCYKFYKYYCNFNLINATVELKKKKTTILHVSTHVDSVLAYFLTKRKHSNMKRHQKAT